MLRESQSAVIARNEIWEGEITTEPYEAGWATEANAFVRALDYRSGTASWSASAAAPGGPGASPLPKVRARVQLSADGMRWIDEGSMFDLPRDTGRDTFVRVRHFGNWLRVAA